MQIRVRIRIQGFDDQKFEKMYMYSLKNIFWVKNCYLLNPKPPLRVSKLQENPSAQKKEHPAHEILNFFLFLWVLFAFLDPDSADQNQSGHGSETLDKSFIMRCQ
jgi:hypothetical protein